MANTLIEEPFNNRINFWDFNLRDVPHWVGHSIFFVCHGVLLALFVLVFSCMWPTRHWWLAKNLAKHSAQGNRSTFWSSTSATEQWWTLVFGLTVISSILIRIDWLLHCTDGCTDYYPWFYTRNTVFGPVKSGLDVAWRGFRCFYLLYLSPRMRYGLVSALYVTTKLGSIAGLVIISFLFHYFLIVAFLPLDDADRPEDNFAERQMYFSSTNEGIYHMFVSLTTANHPDVLMPAYNREWYMMLLLFSFMLVTNLFLLTVFLGVVTSEYATLVKQFYLGKYEVCEGMLRFAYRLVRSRVTRGKTMGSIERTEMNLQDQFRMMVEKDEGIDKHEFKKVIELLSDTHDMRLEIQELWFHIMDVDDDNWINLEEFEKLTYIVSMPFVKLNDIEHTWRFQGV